MKKRLMLLFIMGAALCMNACGAHSSDTAAPESYDNLAYDKGEMNYATMEDAMGAPQVEPGEVVETGNHVLNSERKLIRNVSLDVETKEYDQFMVNLETEITTLGGYMESFDSYNGSYNSKSNRNASIVARIPAEALDSFVNKVGEVANIINRSESVEDVTLQYVDMDSHKKMLLEEQDRLMELLESAATIEEIIAIESRLSDVKYQIESMESQLRTIDNQVDYSTVRIYVSEVMELTPIQEETTWERISGGFVQSIENIGNGFKEAGILFIICIPYIVLWGIIAFIIYKVVRFSVKTFGKKEQKELINKKSEQEE